MEFVTIKHPHPEVADASVPESAVDVWRRSGWLTEEEYAAAELPPTPAPPEDDAPKPIKPAARGRRTTEEKD